MESHGVDPNLGLERRDLLTPARREFQLCLRTELPFETVESKPIAHPFSDILLPM